MFYNDKAKPTNKTKGASDAKRRKIWLGRECDNCGRNKENLISSYKISSIELVRDDEEKVCQSCIDKRKQALHELMEEMIQEQ